MTIIIAEAGVNHNGNFSKALELVDAAAFAKADIVKFQTFKADDLTTFNAEKAKYQIKNTNTQGSQQDMLKKLQLTDEEHYKLKNYCESKGIEFLSTPFDKKSICFLKKLNLKRWKIPSGEINNIPYLRLIGSYGEPIILSTGMSDLEEISRALKIIETAGTNRELITVLQCTTAYPAPIDQINLNAIKTIANSFKVKVGFSDHTNDIFTSIAAVALGATVIEKHFTLDRSMDGPDHKASLEIDELKSMIKVIRNVEKSLGDGIKKPLKCELENIKVARKSIVASTKIKKGEIFTEKNITTKRPGNGISPFYWDEILGTNSSKNYYPDDFIEW